MGKNKRCVPLIEEYLTDLQNKRIEHFSRNIGKDRDYLITHEKSIYECFRSENDILLENGGNPVQNSMTVSKFLALRTDATEYPYFQKKILNFTVNRWKKNSFKQRNGLCYSLAKNNYCPELAKDFQYAGHAGEKWVNAVAKLRTLQKNARAIKNNVKSEITNPKNIRTVVRKTPKL